MKFRKLIVLTLMACLLLTGCIDTKISVNVDENNGGTVTMRVLMEESVHAMVFSEGGLSSGLEDFTQGDKFVGDDGQTYIPFTKTDTYATYEEMVEGLMSIEALVSEDDGDIEANPDIGVEVTNDEADETTSENPEANTSENPEANTSESTEEVKDEAATLFSEVAITKLETTTGYIYTFRAIVQKQGDDIPTVDPATETAVTTEDPEVSDPEVSDPEASDEAKEPIDITSAFGPLATSINNMFKVQLEIVLPVDIQDHAGGVVQGNTLIADIKDLSVDTEIYATGELIVEPVVEEDVEDEFYLPDVTKNPATSGITTYFVYVLISMAIIGTATAIILGVMKLTKRK